MKQTWQEWCATLSERCKAHGVEKTGDEIFNINPHGELYPVYRLEEQLNSIDRAISNSHPKATPKFIKEILEAFFVHHNKAARWL